MVRDYLTKIYKEINTSVHNTKKDAISIGEKTGKVKVK
jgi:hypothetical protein